MNRRDFLKLAGCSIAAGLFEADSFGNNRGDRPNIIFIMADDLGYGGLGCYGASQIKTPNCDRLAQEGVLFTDAHSPSAVCTPTRYSVLTGRYSWRSWLQNWVIGESMPLLIDPDRQTVASMLKSRGYTTGCVGKWHLGWGDKLNPDWNQDLKPGPLEVGFDYFFGVPLSHNSFEKLEVFVENRRIFGLNSGDDINEPQTQRRVRRKLQDTAIELSKAAVSFINKNKDRPFFLYYPSTNIHWPLTPNERFCGKSVLGKYGDSILEFDWAVGEVVNTLDRLNLANKTLIIVTSDNGADTWPDYTRKGHKPNGRLRGAKGEIYEAGHRVPFIARWPVKIPAGSTCDQTISLVDLMATCASIVGYNLKTNEAEDSYDILAALLGEDITGQMREATVHHSVYGLFAIRKGRWKYVEGPGDGKHPQNDARRNASGKGKPERDPNTGKFIPFKYYWTGPVKKSGEPDGQLYDLQSDPREKINLYEKHPEIVKELQGLLDKYRQQGYSRKFK